MRGKSFQSPRKCSQKIETYPSGQKSHGKQNTFGKAEAVPLSKTNFSAFCEALRLIRKKRSD